MKCEGHNLETPSCCTAGLTAKCTECHKVYGVWQHPHKRRGANK